MNRCNRLLILLMFLANCAQSQQEKPDYLVTFQGDTVYGTLKSDLFDRVRLITPSEKFVCDPDKCRALYDSTAHAVYRSALPDAALSRVWLRVVEDGTIKLYNQVTSIRSGASGAGDVWYISKGDSPVVKVKTLGIGGNRSKQQTYLATFFGDDTLVLHAFEDMRSFNMENIWSLIRTYNRRGNKEDKTATLPINLPPMHTRYGKRDFVINSKGDTLYGVIKTDLAFGRTRLFTGTDTITCRPPEYRAFYTAVDSSYFETILSALSGAPAWMKVVSRGSITLYHIPNEAPEQLYARKYLTDEVVDITSGALGGNRARKDRIRMLIADDKEVLQEFTANGELNYAYLLELISIYNKRAQQRADKQAKTASR
ncbi:hypothetical protein [Paraflavitalea sp. CAU 1676]|uniref:hypothetical protein n=1 Tax=Paraflavitalea sp. CAU 1676 TaxID=3032598 RepID=UPI0023DA01E8|nr:hypothetical protein [Paraflavitalea sp. CAU 1676]MDF2188259.1 hypothetical protein [Paraflavitalea sp. CAU 1676]